MFDEREQKRLFRAAVLIFFRGDSVLLRRYRGCRRTRLDTRPIGTWAIPDPPSSLSMGVMPCQIPSPNSLELYKAHLQPRLKDWNCHNNEIRKSRLKKRVLKSNTRPIPRLWGSGVCRERIAPGTTAREGQGWPT